MYRRLCYVGLFIFTFSSLTGIDALGQTTTDTLHKSAKDTSEKSGKINLKKNFPSGSISAEYDYGLIPFTTISKVPDQLLRTEGTMSASILKLPFNAVFSYTNSKNILGLNNYFRISFDAEQYKQRTMGKVSAKQEEYKNKLKSLYSYRQEATQQLEYLKYIQQFPQLKVPKMPTDSLHVPDILFHTPSFHLPSDSLKNKIPSLPKIPNTSQNTDSLKNLADNKKYQDSIQKKINAYEEKIKETNDQIDQAQKQLNRLENPVTAVEQEYLYQNKFYRFVKGVKKFDVGLCYPTHSTFLVNGIVLRGVNFEWQSRRYYFAFTHGKTINNIFYSNNIIQNNLNVVRNFYNFFDFNSVASGRRITAVKFGVGQKNDSHFYVGVLSGLGHDSYYKDPSYNYSPSLQKNYVVEIDGKLVLDKNNSFDVAYGKSIIRTNDNNIDESENGFNALFKSSNRSHAALARYNTSISKTRTHLTFTTRWIDPYFKSFGVGFIRPDNFRYEIKTEQQLTKKIKLSGFYRHEEDNLLALLSNTTSLKSAGANVTWRVNKRLTLRGGYTPVFLQVKSGETVVQKNDNHIGNFIFTYIPKAKKIKSVFTGMYSYYLLYDGIKNNEFKNASLLYSLETENGIKNDMSGNWLYSTASGSLFGQTYLVTDELSVGIKKVRVAGGAKYALSEKYSNQIGYSLKVNVPVAKSVTMEAGAEKIILGEFYSNLNLVMLNTFPYFCFARLTVHW